MNPEDRLKQMLGRVRGEDRVTESNWKEFTMSGRRSIRIQRFAAAGLAVVLLGVAGVGAFAAFGDSGSGGDLDPAAPTTSESPTEGSLPPPPLDPSEFPNEPPPDKVSRPVEVWLVDPQSGTLSWGYTILQVQPDALLQEVIVNLLEGPTSPDVEAGVETAIHEDVKLLSVEVVDGVARVEVSGEFLRPVGPDGAEYRNLAIAQLVFQATQVEGVDQATILVDGKTIEEPASRDDFADLAPPIVVNEPRIGSEHESPLLLSGTANVFEATVSYKLEIPGDGETVSVKSFTTASCGSGCRGEFADEIPFKVDEPTDATLRVFEVSAEDGSRLNEVIIPLRLLPND
jgi:Immunoglobulin-like domain of bacterial spore germination/Sporulation and spore germination